MYTESTVYRYIEDLSTPKEWFKANIDMILKTFGNQHRIQKEDVFLGESDRMLSFLILTPVQSSGL